MDKNRMQEFEEARDAWMERHLRARRGERKDRLKRGHGHGEALFLKNVWWPLVGNFDDLHPEYEVRDWRGGTLYLDFAWLPGLRRFNIDVKGFGPHVQQADRTGYRRELMRELYLHSRGYTNISIAYDALKEDPALIRDFLKPDIMRYARAGRRAERPLAEQALLDYARKHSECIYPSKAADELGLDPRTVIKYLKKLMLEGKVQLISAGKRARRYRYVPELGERG